MADSTDDLLKLPVGVDSPDPVEGNPFSEKDIRHSIWQEATKRAELAHMRLNKGFLEKTFTTLEDKMAWHMGLCGTRYDIWAERGVQVILAQELLPGWDAWLADFANGMLKEFARFDPPEFGVQILRDALIGKREHWKAEARRFVALQEEHRARLSDAKTSGGAEPEMQIPDGTNPEDVVGGLRRAASAYPKLSARWHAEEKRWTLHSEGISEPEMPSPEAQRVFKELARSALAKSGRSAGLAAPWSVWLDLLKEGNRGFQRIKQALTFRAFRDAMENGTNLPEGTYRLLNDGIITGVFQQSADLLEDLLASLDGSTKLSQDRTAQSEPDLLSDPSAASERDKVYKTALGRNVDVLRKECGWSFDMLAEKTGLDKKLILGHVNDGTKARPNTVKIYAQAFTKGLERAVPVAELES